MTGKSFLGVASERSICTLQLTYEELFLIESFISTILDNYKKDLLSLSTQVRSQYRFQEICLK